MAKDRQSFRHCPRNPSEEYQYWRALCDLDTCPPAIYGTLDMGGMNFGQSDVFRNGAVLITDTGLVRNLKSMQSARGATREEIERLATDAGHEKQNPMGAPRNWRREIDTHSPKTPGSDHVGKG